MHIYERNSVFSAFCTTVNNFLPILFWILLVFSFGTPALAVTTLLSATVHECGHVFHLYIIGKKHCTLRGVLSGLRLSGRRTLSYNEEFTLYLAGPLANVIAAILGLLSLPSTADFSVIFASVNIATALSNLLPVYGYDGYGMLRVFIEKRCSGGTGLKVLSAVSFTTVATLALLSLYFMARFGSGYWIFTVFLLSAVKELSKMLENQKAAFKEF